MRTRSGFAGVHLHEDDGGRGQSATRDRRAPGTSVGTGVETGAGHWGAVGQIGRFQLQGTLGRGSAATVFRALDAEDHQTVALKVFSDPADDPGIDDHCHREAAMLERSRHDGVVRLLGHGIDAAGHTGIEHHHLSLELVEGTDLRKVIGTRYCTSEETVSWGIQLLQALTHIHHMGIAHRDIKPANILIGAGTSAPAAGNGTTATGATTAGPAKLTDFGSAAFGTAIRPGTSAGTAQYTSPEQAHESAAGPAGDIYSLALVLIECLSGKPAFMGIPLATMVARTLRRPQLPQGIAPRLSRLLWAMTAMDPGERPSASAAVSELARV